MSSPSTVDDVTTPALVLDADTFETNLATMSAALPGLRLRPHAKAFKSTAVANRLAEAGHVAFCAATPREIEGLAAAGLGDDLLLANETLDTARLGALTDHASVTVAIDSDATLEAAVRGGVGRVLIDVNVGLPRCGCPVSDAGRLAEKARAAGLEVRGVMGYEGHLMMVLDRDEQRAKVERSMAWLLEAHRAVGGDIVSGGGTGTFDVNTWCTEIQAGSYLMMDTHYDTLGLPFDKALRIVATVISIHPKGWLVADAGLKAFGMDHGDPSWDEGEVLFCSDEHVTLRPESISSFAVGDRVSLWPAHVDPTVARHEQYWLADRHGAITDRWAIDLRHW